MKKVITFIGCLLRIVVRGIYFPRFNYDRRTIVLEDWHPIGNRPIYRICFASLPDKDMSPVELSSISIYAVNNSDPKKIDIYCTDVINSLASNHFMGTIAKGVPYDLSMEINTSNYQIARVVVNISPITHHSPHTIQLTMPIYNKVGLIYRR